MVLTGPNVTSAVLQLCNSLLRKCERHSCLTNLPSTDGVLQHFPQDHFGTRDVKL